jgi:uncharacterized protein
MISLVVASVVLGALAQRITGMGFALVVSPALVLLLGPFDGVLIVNACGALSAAFVLTRVWRDVDWGRYLLLVVPAIVAIIPGAILATALPANVLEISVGILLIVALTASLLIARTSVILRGPLPAIGGGALSGFMNAVAGIGGPGVSIYAVLSRWNQAAFAATLQPYFLTVGLVSLGSKLAFSGGQLPGLDWWEWVLLVIALIVGLILGELVGKRLSGRAARIAVIVIAYVGSAIAILHGVTG